MRGIDRNDTTLSRTAARTLWPGLRVLAMVVPIILETGVGVFAQSREDEEYCFNSDQQKVLMIAGGKDANLADWPFIGALRQRVDFNAEQFLCGGSFLSATWFLTAGHCVATADGVMSATLERTDLPKFSVSQSLDQRSRAVDTTSTAIKRIELAPGFAKGRRNNGEFADHDVALLKLVTPFKFAMKNVYFPIPVTAHFERLWAKADSCAAAAGWGLTEEGRLGTFPAHGEPARLQAMNLPIWDDAACTDSRYWPDKQSYQFCAGFKILQKNSCRGDSGGPLVIRDAPTGFALVGVLNAGPGRSCPGDKPNLYTRVSAHHDWIDQTISGDPK
jgi:Trypsin